jgi:T5orf172 domain
MSNWSQDSETPRSENQQVHDEIQVIFETEDSQFADIWRRTQAGQTPEEIRVALGPTRTTFVWNYLRTARAILDGDLPTAPSVALSAARTLRRFLKQHSFTPETKKVLEERLLTLEGTATNQEARAVEDESAREATTEAEDNAVPGVYVYSLPHYLRHPYDEDSGRTLLKVGRADRSVIKRFREQIRTTALPEEPVLLRIYVCPEDGSVAYEATFHRLLVAADHDRSKARTGGTEWFLSSVRFLDEVAATLGLEVRHVSDMADVI